MKYEKHLSSLKAQDEQIFAKYVKNHRPEAIRVPQKRGTDFQYRVDLEQRAHRTDLFKTANLALKCKILEAREEDFQCRSMSVAQLKEALSQSCSMRDDCANKCKTSYRRRDWRH